MIACPICATECLGQKHGYHVCPNCSCWHQSPMPPKIYHDPDAPTVMSERDKAVNRDLAKWLFEHVMQGKPGRTLDVGCGPYPYLANCLRGYNCDSDAIDGGYYPLAADLIVQSYRIDFESCGIDPRMEHDFALITSIHNFEHLEDPLAALRKLRKLIADDGHVFLRLPDHGVRGFEAHLKLNIHPFFHCLDSILEALRQTETFTVAETSVMDSVGQRDILLRPIL